MDLENELRKAMAEHTAEASAPPSLTAAVRRRHRRRVVRIRVTVGTVAAAAVAAFVITPAYQSMTRVDPAGARETPTGSATAASPNRSAPPPVPGLPGSPPSPGRSGTGDSQDPSDRTSSTPTRRDQPGAGLGTVPRPGWVDYLPSGLKVDQPCTERSDAKGRTTTCRWRGTSGWVEIRVVRGAGATGPDDLSTSPSMPRYTSVRGIRAVVTDRPDSGRQVSWMERPGVEVVVAVGGGSVRDQLMRIANGVRPS
jgi:hypothetical protein